ncbi:MAG: valine--tRNA ligase [bacterium]|jgi:valyl-tRNA synthetase
MTAQKNLPTVYDPKAVESKWYDYWLTEKYFHAEVDKDKKPYSIVIPPPNVTGSLHMGHALNNTLQDILIRWHRMLGENVVWIPGTDHAGIATQVVVERELAKEGKTRHDLGREAFIERVWQWKEQYGNRIIEQLQRLGTSCDWDRERFTMDERCSRAVREVFVHLYEKGLIYQGDFIINWCPRCLTALSDLEVEHNETGGRLHYVRYSLADSDESIMVATTRPETILGDTGIAVHPEDERYRHLIGRNALLPLLNRELPIIADDYVDPEFGTGAVKVTPAHDPNDFAMGERHNLPSVVVIDEKGGMNENAGKYAGMDRYECRQAILADLKTMGFLVKVEEHTHAVGHCSRCDTVVEPMLSKQWFVKMQPLAEPAMQVVREGKIKFVPERFADTYLYWLENIHDWCISRQLWWGHRIPAWYCRDCGEVLVAKEDPTQCGKCGGKNLVQDPDVLDTWFSSALWPFSTLGWPDETPELEHFYPTSVLATGYDIIFFWVARMIFMGLEFRQEIPFHEVFINGLIRDAEGKKMSKSRGNTIDPLGIIEQYGTDTLRFTLVTGSSPGNDIRLFTEKFEGIRNFANKIWNASRFVLMNQDDTDAGLAVPAPEQLTLADKWIIGRYNFVAGEITRLLARYDFSEASKTLYDFIWNEYCDWYIELAKPRLYGKENAADRKTAQAVLRYVLSNTLKLLHPFMPFITEEIWQALPHDGESIMVSPWPEPEIASDPAAEATMELCMEVIKSIRSIRAEMGVAPGKKADVILQAAEAGVYADLEAGLGYIEQLGSAAALTLTRTLAEKPRNAAAAITRGVEIYLPLKGLIDIDKEIGRLESELATARAEIGRAAGKLANTGFLAKAPAEVVEKEKAKQAEYQEKESKIKARIRQLKEMA